MKFTKTPIDMKVTAAELRILISYYANLISDDEIQMMDVGEITRSVSRQQMFLDVLVAAEEKHRKRTGQDEQADH